VSLTLFYLLTRPLDRLARYADGIRLGEYVPFPKLGRTVIADLGLALHRMQEALEGRQYAEEYVQTLTHELKSPLSAIRGAAELLQEEMPAPERARFLANIRTEAARIARIVYRMLELAKLEIAAPERLTVAGNAFLLHQALANLVQNAIEFSPQGGTVQVAVTPERDRVTIAVTDQGPGIPEYALGRIFDRLYSLGRPDT